MTNEFCSAEINPPLAGSCLSRQRANAPATIGLTSPGQPERLAPPLQCGQPFNEASAKKSATLSDSAPGTLGFFAKGSHLHPSPHRQKSKRKRKQNQNGNRRRARVTELLTTGGRVGEDLLFPVYLLHAKVAAGTGLQNFRRDSSRQPRNRRCHGR